jgi:hypothetical protein
VEGRFGRDIESGRFHAAVRDLDSAAIRYGLARRLADGVLHGRETMAYHDVRMRWYRGDCDPEARRSRSRSRIPIPRSSPRPTPSAAGSTPVGGSTRSKSSI